MRIGTYYTYINIVCIVEVLPEVREFSWNSEVLDGMGYNANVM